MAVLQNPFQNGVYILDDDGLHFLFLKELDIVYRNNIVKHYSGLRIIISVFICRDMFIHFHTTIHIIGID